ncbi:hypothetical protein DEM27_01560 [Metarhizobium album]|uniref:Uncharacterized protein n=1 Tax=Metarhizobium album TaxID=2182425 RepID=A0A2U2DX59_9HYPH|nr:hypothetical protein [Rhizobium album]PWE57907.1 hypothetical protein DEM27_01560 [Rhizobium album]
MSRGSPDKDQRRASMGYALDAIDEINTAAGFLLGVCMALEAIGGEKGDALNLIALTARGHLDEARNLIEGGIPPRHAGV